jgi:hypothetical protein
MGAMLTIRIQMKISERENPFFQNEPVTRHGERLIFQASLSAVSP